MPVLLCLNELSCGLPARRGAANQAMTDFVGVLQHVRRLRREVALVTPAPFADLELAHGLSARRWAAGGRAREQFRYVQRLRDRRVGYGAVLPGDCGGEVDYHHGEHRAEGLGAAHLCDGLAVSIPLDGAWHASTVSLHRDVLCEDTMGEVAIRGEEVAVRHASQPAHAKRHGPWISRAGAELLTTGAQLWAARGDLFPNLCFLPRVEQDLLDLQTAWVAPVRTRLLELQVAVAQWDPARDPAPAYHSYVTSESATRRRLCHFDDLDGHRRLFEWHARFTPGPGRLHFRLLPEQASLTVAYIGRKLGV